MILVVGPYSIVVNRRKERVEVVDESSKTSKKRKIKFTAYDIEFWRYHDGDVKLLFTLKATRNTLANAGSALYDWARKINDEFLMSYSDDIVESVKYYVESWDYLLKRNEIMEAMGIVSLQTEGGVYRRNTPGEKIKPELLFRTSFRADVEKLVKILQIREKYVMLGICLPSMLRRY